MGRPQSESENKREVGQKRNGQVVGHKGVFGETPVFSTGRLWRRAAEGLRAAPMGAEWCLLLCLVLSGAADAGEWGAGWREVLG